MSEMEYYDYPNSTTDEYAEIISTIVLLVGGFLAIFIAYVFGVCKNKSHNNFVMFNTLLITYDWIFYIIFTIWSFATRLYIIPLVNLPIFCIMVFFNTLLTITILRREFNNNEQFRVWFKEHKAFGIFIAFCSLGNVNVLHVLNCKFNYMDKFDAKLSFTAEKKIIHASVIGLILGDIPRFFLLTELNLALSKFYAIPVTSLSLNFLVLTFGFFYRLYESMIRGYENPTVQELIVVNRKQFLEA